MYKAKKSGKNKTVFYKEDYQYAADLILTLKHELISAFKNNEFVLYYQPQYDCNKTKITGYEALVRWQHPERGLIPPGKFLPYMEQIGYLKQLDHWVVERMYHDISTFDALTENMTTISINISANSFEDPDFVLFIKDMSQQFNIAPSRIILEITEDLLMKNISISDNDILNQIINLGFQFAIDDFGTGYSSLAYLSELKFDVIKIDMKFVQGIEVSRTDRQICKMILQLAKELDVKIVAEGVETQEQLEFVKKYGADIIQGYLFSRPLSLEHVITA
jgi:EAL domain-containing protein (putative c-di-GMP-specific phosphodiesterase class I)